MKNGKKFLTKEKDILDEVMRSDSDEEIENTSQKKVIRRPLKRKSSAAPRIIDDPAPQTNVATPRRTRRFQL